MAGGTAMVWVGRHQLAATVYGTGGPTVVIEPSFGGWARDWEPIAQALARETAVITYDRAPYGASSPARDTRTPGEIAADLDGLLRALDVRGPVVLVGHSAGGIYVRAYAAAHLDRVAGMVLVESSHERQRRVLDPVRSRRARLDMALTIPSVLGGSRRQRRGGDRRSIIREWRSFCQVTAGPPTLPAGALGDRPLVVLTCGPDAGGADRPYRAWRDLHRDLAGLSANSRHLVSGSPAHYLQAGDPGLVTAAIRDVVRAARDGGPLAGPAVPATALAPMMAASAAGAEWPGAGQPAGVRR